MTTWSFSQSTYPKILMNDGDTVVAITPPQLLTVNRHLNSYIHLKKMTELLQMDILVSDSLIRSQKTVMQKQDSITLFQKIQVNESIRFVDDLESQLKKQKKTSRKNAIFTGLGCTVIGVIAGILILK